MCYTDKNGDLPDPIYKEWTALWEFFYDNYTVELQVINDANNTKLSMFYAYAKSKGTKYASQVKGAFGEAHFYKKINSELSGAGGNINKSYGLAPYGVSSEMNLGGKVGGYQIDLQTTIHVTTGEFLVYAAYNLKNTDLYGKVGYTMVEENNNYYKKKAFSSDEINIGYEIKTNNPYSNVNYIFESFSTGVQQIKDRVNTSGLDIMVLVFDYEAIQKLLKSECKDQVLKLYDEMINFSDNNSNADSDQVLFLRLVYGQYSGTMKTLNNASENVRELFPTETEAKETCIFCNYRLCQDY